MKKMRLKKWVKVVLCTFLLSTFLIEIYKLFTITTTTVCDGNKAVRDYLGVN